MSALHAPGARVAIAGGSLAGLSAARTLRAEGFDGELTIVGAEPHLPYERPALSKAALGGAAAPGELAASLALDLGDLDATWRPGTRADALDLRLRELRLDGGERLGWDGLVVATGAAPRALPGCEVPVHRLRTLEDAAALNAAVAAGGRLAIVGGGFIGCEVAAGARARGLDVTVVEGGAAPLAAALGDAVAHALAARLRALGVELRCGRGVAAVTAAGVTLDDGTLLAADHVLVAIGASPATGWLAGSGLVCRDGVVCDSESATAGSRVVAAGDVARWWHAGCGRRVRIEHWEHAELHGAAAARRLLHGPRGVPFAPVPFVASELGPHVLHLAGWPRGRLELLDGALDDGPFAAAWVDGPRVAGVVALDSPRAFRRLRRRLDGGLAAADLHAAAAA